MSSSRVIILGWDGISHPLALNLARTGHMPNLATLLEQGSSLPMRTEHPPLSPVCWTSFFTGSNPGRHRIFGFYEPAPDAYGCWEQNLEQVRLPGLWDHAGAAGKRTVCLNLPGTYPAPPIQGVLVSGFPVGDWTRAVYPKSLREILPKAGYVTDVDCAGAAAEPEIFFTRCAEALRGRGHVFHSFLQNEPFDLFIGVFTEMDRIQHYFYSALEEENHPHRQAVLALFSLLDEQLGLCLEGVKPDDDLWIVADHGFRRIQIEVCVNAILEEAGWLTMRPEIVDAAQRQDLSGISPAATRAFCLDPGRIYLNVKGRQPEGIVPAHQRRETAEALREILETWKIRVPWSAVPTPVFERVSLREEIYEGPFLGLAPDLVGVPAEGMDLKGVFGMPGVSRLREFTGMHSYNDAFLYRRAPHPLPENPGLRDLARPILDQLGIGDASLPV